MTMIANPLKESLSRLKASGRKALVAYTTAGDPDLDTTLAVMEVLAAEVADVVELGVPYSDPLADGPVIQAAARALQAIGCSAGSRRTADILQPAPLIRPWELRP